MQGEIFNSAPGKSTKTPRQCSGFTGTTMMPGGLLVLGLGRITRLYGPTQPRYERGSTSLKQGRRWFRERLGRPAIGVESREWCRHLPSHWRRVTWTLRHPPLPLVHSVLAFGCSCGKFSLCHSLPLQNFTLSFALFASSPSSPSSPLRFFHHFPSFLKAFILAALSTILLLLECSVSSTLQTSKHLLVFFSFRLQSQSLSHPPNWLQTCLTVVVTVARAAATTEILTGKSSQSCCSGCSLYPLYLFLPAHLSIFPCHHRPSKQLLTSLTGTPMVTLIPTAAAMAAATVAPLAILAAAVTKCPNLAQV